MKALYSDADLKNALQHFASVVGGDWLFSGPDDIATYTDAYSPFALEPDLQLLPAAAIAPITVEQVQQIVRIANRYKIPLYPISTGRNLGYGGAGPTMRGTVMLDLKRMNRILEVNEKEAYALVEPGVSFFDLYHHLRDHKIPLLVSTPEPGWGSPIGNALDHGIGGIAGDNFAQIHGLEVVLPNGELLRTGSGASRNSYLWQNYRYGFGPHIDGIFSQSNFGIVTKAGFWLQRAIGVQQSFMVTSFKSEDLSRMTDALQLLRSQDLIRQFGCGSPIRGANSTVDGHISQHIPEVSTLLKRQDGGSFEEWDALGKRVNVPVSIAFADMRGPKTIIDAALQIARDLFAGIEGAQFNAAVPVTLPADPAEINDENKGNVGIPQLWGFNRLTLQGTSRGHYYLSPLCKPNAADLFALNDTIRRVILDAGDMPMLEHYGWQPGLGAYPKALMILMDFLVYDDAKLNQRRRELFRRIATACAAHGWTEYRTPAAFQSEVMDLYSFNNHALRRFLETLKDAIDPNGILAPGKAGIWPKSQRSTNT
jgi:FAD/FMN-containing dehydrogenase